MNLTDVPIWVQASIRKTIIDRNQGRIKLFFEGDDRQTNKYKEFFEIRVDGPYFDLSGTKDEISIYTEVNILINSTRNEENLFGHQRLMGIATQLLNTDFCIYKIGHKDYDSLFYCTLSLMPSEQIKNSYFGQVEQNVQVFQSTVEAHYLGIPENS